MRLVVVLMLGFAAMLPGRAEAASFGVMAGLVEAARDEVLTAEVVSRRSYSPRRYSSTRSGMRVSRPRYFTRNYRSGYAPSRTRW